MGALWEPRRRYWLCGAGGGRLRMSPFLLLRRARATSFFPPPVVPAVLFRSRLLTGGRLVVAALCRAVPRLALTRCAAHTVGPCMEEWAAARVAIDVRRRPRQSSPGHVLPPHQQRIWPLLLLSPLPPQLPSPETPSRLPRHCRHVFPRRSPRRSCPHGRRRRCWRKVVRRRWQRCVGRSRWQRRR